MNKQKYASDLEDIRTIMDRSSKFTSLSGLSGIFAGFKALIGAYAAYETVYQGQNYLSYRTALLDMNSLLQLVLVALCTLGSTIGIGLYFTYRKAKIDKRKMWDLQAKRVLINLAIPLLTGGVLSLMLLFRGLIGLVAPLTLIFYGLGLLNASKYTYSELRSLGILQIAVGLLAVHFIGYGLLFWSAGFGILHIVYGAIMHFKYGS